ncbi:MAG TPA: adenylate/guanylate cyclase domain-containing protein [Xanthobacteraceae bacterium]|nr:adenylate/guanylate cyclase domain-containing protein [Xanthobacteraceae bacterium]
MTDVAEWLEAIGLPEYAQCFAENAIDLSVLRDLTDQDLKDLGVLLGHRRKMLRAIAELQTAPPPSAKRTIEPARPKEAERRHLTLMFCDLVGSTALSARLDPEDMQTVISAYYNCVADVIGRHQGTIARYIGDGVLVYFGYPQAHEDDAEQAVRAGLALTGAVSRLRTVPDAELSTRIGIATGLTVVGDLIGQGAAQDQAIAGETPNLAARLQTLAQPGEVLICANTRRLTGGQFDYRDLGRVALKGWTEPAHVWQALGPSGVESRFEAMHHAKVQPPFGREEDLELLFQRWRRAREEEGQVVVLTGEPGIGKSHVAFAFAERLQNEPHVVLRYFCSAHHTNSVLFPIIGQLERAARFELSDTPADKVAKINNLVSRSTENPEQAAVLANLMGLPTGERYRLQELTPQQRKEKTFSALLAQLDNLSAGQPVFMIFEDVHWIDPTSLELLAATVERVPQLRVLVLITARPEFAPPWPSYSHTTTVPLSRLGRRYGAALVERVAGGRVLPRELLDEILARTDGVPLFIEELTKTVLESDLLDQRNGQYVLDRPLPAFAIPNTLHASLMARLDRLAAVRDVAQIGAVVGREFHFELLRAVSGLARAGLEEALEQLVRSELAFRRGETPDAVYIFKHTLVRDAAYAGLLKTRRAQLHAAVASALEQHFPAVVQGQPETLARHFTEAGQTDKAIAYWLQAGKNAALRSANLEAIAHLQRGIELAGRLPAGQARDRSELDLQLILGPCLSARHGPASSDALGTFARARELCERLGQPPEYLQVMFSLATASVMRGELPQALEAIAGLPAAAEARGNRAAVVNGIRGQAMILMFMGRLVEAREALERAAQVFGSATEAERVATRSAGQDAGVSMLVLMAWVLWTLGQVNEAVSRIAAALDRANTVQHAHTHAYAWYYASVLHALRGELSIAEGYAERCLAISEQHGFRHWVGLSRAIRGTCATLLDPSADSVEVTKSLEEYQRAGYQLGLTAQFVLLCPALLSRNLPEAALMLIEQGLAIASKNEERFFEAELYRIKAKALLMRGGSVEEAKVLLDQALRTARGQQARSLELRAATDLARVWMNEGKRTEAVDVLSSVYGLFTEGFETRDLEEAKAVLVQLQAIHV